MTISAKQETLQNSLRTFNFPAKYFIQIADRRIGHKFALASNTDNGGLNVHSSFMTYDEFNCYLRGYYDAKMKKYNR